MPAPPPQQIASLQQEGSARLTLSLILALCVGFAAVWAYVFLSQKPPVASGAITALVAVPVHYEVRNGGSLQEGQGGGVDAEDQVFVLAAVTVKSATKLPLYAWEQTGTLTTPEGEQKRVRALSPTDAERAFAAYPRLAQARRSLSAGDALPREATLQPGQSEQGFALFAFPLKAEDWETRRTFDIAVSFRWQRELVLDQPSTQPGAQTEPQTQAKPQTEAKPRTKP